VKKETDYQNVTVKQEVEGIEGIEGVEGEQ